MEVTKKAMVVWINKSVSVCDGKLIQHIEKVEKEVKYLFYEEVKPLIRNRLTFIDHSLNNEIGKKVVLNVISLLIIEHDIDEQIIVTFYPEYAEFCLTNDDNIFYSEINSDKDEFLSKYCKADVFLYKNKRGAKIQCKRNLLDKNIMLFCSAISRIIPDFICSETLGDLDTKILKELFNGNSKEVLEMISKWGDSQDIENKVAESVFRNFLNSTKDKAIERYLSSIKDARNQITFLEEKISVMLKDISQKESFIEEQSILLENQQSQYASEDSIKKLAQFFKSLDGIKIEQGPTKETLYISLRQPLESVDQSLLDYLIKNDGGSIYNYAPSVMDARLLYEALWKTKKIKLFVNCNFRMDGMVTRIGNYDTCYYCQDGNSIPHPHIVKYGCIGGFVDSFAEIARNGDIYSAIMTMIASCKSLNLADSVVCNSFSKSIFSESDSRPFYYDNKFYSANEMIKILKGEKHEKAKNE